MYLGSTDLKMPDNHFLKWLNDKICENKIHLQLSSSSERYLTDFIKIEEIDSWKPNTPVFISSQTGTGKNYFVQHVLIRNLIKDNFQNHTNQKILLLSNRVALNRQSKKDIADLLLDYTGQNFSQEMEIYYKQEGIDAFLKKFGNVYIYSYKQFSTTNFLNQENQDFKYVVCDECHYFTSDGTFEPYTEQILKKIIKEGQDSIRIYMSATPDVVFEPIIREEYNLIKYNENLLKEIGNKKIEELYYDSERSNKKENPNNGYVIANPHYLTGQEFFDRLKGFDPKKEIENRVIEVTKDLFPLNIKFFYMERNYDYIQKVFFYENEEELINKVKSDLEESNTKWLIFVRDKKTGNQLLEGIRNPTTCKFINADSRKNSNEEKEEFNRIVQNESFEAQVLISTSTLDNGINIKDDSVKNIVIDLLDRTEFLQMLGRVRINDETNINLFVRKYEKNDIEKMLKKCIKNLLLRLEIDTIPPEKRIEWLDRQRINDNMFYNKNFVYNGENYCYNSNAVYHLIDEARLYMKYLKRIDENYHLSFEDLSIEIRGLRSKIYNYYLHEPEGKNRCWSRIIIDLLESKEDSQERQKEIINDCKRGIENRYQYIFDETFLNFLYDELLPEYYRSLIESGVNKFVKLTPNFNSSFNVWDNDNVVNVNPNGKTPLELAMAAKSKNEEISSFEKIKTLKELFDIEIDTSKYQRYDSKINYYKSLAYYGAFENSMDIQMYWLEKLGYKPEKIQLSKIPEVEVAEIENNKKEFFEIYLKNCVVSQEELENHKHIKKGGEPSDIYYDAHYLEEHGIKKDSPESEKFTLLYKTKLNKGQRVIINETLYKIQSCSDGTEQHNTYYVLQPIKLN